MSDPMDHAERCVTRARGEFSRREVVSLIAKAIRDEREACAAIADSFNNPAETHCHPTDDEITRSRQDYSAATAKVIAAEIRVR